MVRRMGRCGRALSSTRTKAGCVCIYYREGEKGREEREEKGRDKEEEELGMMTGKGRQGKRWAERKEKRRIAEEEKRRYGKRKEAS